MERRRIPDKEKFPVLTFSYFTLQQMGALKSILLASSNALKKLSDGYALYMSQSNALDHLCVVYQIPKEDLEDRPERDIPTAMYNRFIEQFGKDKVDLLVRDKDSIMENIKSSIQFAMDEIYTTDEMIIKFDTIDCLNAADIVMGRTSSIPDIIYRAAQEEFEIITQAKELRTNKLLLLIKKRGASKDDEGETVQYDSCSQG